MKLRKVNKKTLFWSGVGYRTCMILVTCLSLKFLLPKVNTTLLLALYVNIVNMCVYYVYHYLFLERFKMGEK